MHDFALQKNTGHFFISIKKYNIEMRLLTNCLHCYHILRYKNCKPALLYMKT